MKILMSIHCWLIWFPIKSLSSHFVILFVMFRWMGWLFLLRYSPLCGEEKDTILKGATWWQKPPRHPFRSLQRCDCIWSCGKGIPLLHQQHSLSCKEYWLLSTRLEFQLSISSVRKYTVQWSNINCSFSMQKAYIIHWVRLDRFSSVEKAYNDGVERLEKLVARIQNVDLWATVTRSNASD